MGSIPTNIVDVANQIQSGDVGIIDVVTLGNLTISALTGISGSDKKSVTRRPVQAGFQVVKGIVSVPTDKFLNIVLADPDFSAEAGIQAALTGSLAGFTESWRDKKDLLYEMFNEDGESEIFEARLPNDVWHSRFISEIEQIHDVEEDWNCFIARVTLSPFDNRQQGSVDDVETAMTSAYQDIGAL